ncbi:MAG: gamma-glutamyl-gamma-aminobutyrate hydrolase family protein [Microbacteriaceae bacterium]
MTSRPVIGISTYRQPASWSSWLGTPTDLLPSAYAESLSAAGAAAVLIPPVASPADAQAVVARLDGLVLAGGADLNPALYGQEPHRSVNTWYDDRDRSELWLLDAAGSDRLPLLGVCRGMQMMAVHAGGGLTQHLPELTGNENHSGTANGYGSTRVVVDSGHRISELVSPEILVACHHHQSVERHPGFVATAHSGDGVVEAMESLGDRFEVAVQWHPETAADKGLFSGLVAAATAFSSSRGR